MKRNQKTKSNHMIKSDIKILKERALAGDLSALEELRKMGLLSGKKSGYVIAPASYSQRRLWFIDQMDKSPAYNLPALIKFSGELDIDALERSFKELIKRHETLRTVFTENEGVPYQKIYTTSDFRLKKEDVRGREDKSSIIDELIREESRRCFDLTGGPLLVCSLLRTEESEYILIFNMHHIISDGWSIGVMIAELTSFYNAFSSGKEAEISPLPVQYRDYAKRQEGILNSPQAEIHRDYWVDKFSGEIPLPDLVADNARPLQKSYSGAVYVTQIEKNLLPEIKELCYKTESSLFMFLLSVVNLLINKYTGKTDIILGTPVSGREYGDTEGLIGFFVNTIPLRNKIDPDADFNSLLNSVKNESLNSFDHQMYPFDLLVEELGTERDTSRNPLFETVVSLQDKQENTLPFRGVRAEIAEPDINYSKFDLHFSFEESPQELGVRIVYNPDLYRRAKIEKMAGHLGVLIENIIASPDVPLRRLEFISKEESDYIKKTLSNKSSAKTSEKSIVELFSEIVTKYPQKPAVVYRGIPLSYTQLDNRSDTYASRLKEEYCIKRDEVVAVLMGRSHELLVSILGILKAGGAYLPVDENMPEERI
ncbi:MAG: condensation domain-containing protein, partial [Bacteroidales bacterium]|nr:condensation domain-containing protein [Bacteroidales bacterium]